MKDLIIAAKMLQSVEFKHNAHEKRFQSQIPVVLRIYARPRKTHLVVIVKL